MKKFKILTIAIGLIYAFTADLHAQNDIISGIVTDAKGQGLPGVNVIIDGTSDGTITDIEGRFNINVQSGQVLVFKMVGMEEQRVEISNQSSLSISLNEETTQLSEIVITGFQEVERKLFTGSAESLKMEDVEISGEADVSRMLEGRVAGVAVDNVSGTFGSAARIRIRGNTSIYGNNQPLFVVDGVILEDLNNVDAEDFLSGNTNTLISSSIAGLNANDIASYEVLKDAAASAIYGARAANGVIVITTKRGKSGALQVNYSGNFSAKLRPTYNDFDLMNSAEEMEVYREMYDKGIISNTSFGAAENYGAMGKMFSFINAKELEWGSGGTLNEEYLNKHENANTDWFDLLFNDFGLQQQHALSFTSGTDKSNNYYSLSYMHDQGQTIADKVQRLTATARNTYFISDAFTFGFKLTGSYRDQRVPGTRNREFDPLTGQYSRSFDINPLSYALNTSRSMRPYDDDGNPEYYRRNFAPFNILEELKYNFIDINVVDLSSQFDFEVRPIKDIKVNGVFQVRYANTKSDHTVHEKSNQAEAYRANQTQGMQENNNLLFYDPDEPNLAPKVVLPVGGFKYLDQTDLLNVFFRASAEYSKTFYRDFDVNVLGGVEMRYTDRTNNSSTAMGVLYDNGGVVITDPNILKFFNLQNVKYYELYESKDRFFGLFLNGGVSYKSRYIANFTVRYDGSNQLGDTPQARYLPTWNVSAAWNASDEPFMSGVSFISDLKLRGTYGLSGNLPPGTSAQLKLISDVTVRPTDVEPYLYIEDLTNSDLTWEKLNELNGGIEFGVLNRRIHLAFDYYKRYAYDLIGAVITSGIGGQGYKVGNFADMESDGYEFTLSTINLEYKGLTWTSDLNFGYTDERITKLDIGPRIADAIAQDGAPVLGGTKRSLYSTKMAGLTSQGVPQFYNLDGEKVYQYDLQSREDLTEILKYEGPIEPKLYGGFDNTFKYKNFSLGALISYKFGHVIRLNDAFYSSYSDYQALPGDLKNRWVVPGDEQITDIPTILPLKTENKPILTTDGDGNPIIRYVPISDYEQAYNLYNKSDVRVAKGDYIRLKTIRLSYNVPAIWVSKLRMRTASLSLEGNNLALLYADKKLNGQDPEFFSSGGVALPPPRTFTLALTLGL